MKKNDERIVKYLSELMDANESSAFENEIQNSASLKAELDCFKDTVNGMKFTDVSVDERYFANLVPKIKTTVEKTSFFTRIPKYAYAASTLTVIVLFSLFTFRSNRTNAITSRQIVQEIVKNLDDERVLQKYITELELDFYHNYNSDIANATTQPIVVDDVARQKILVAYDTPINEEMVTSQKLSEEELHSIYENIETKILH